MKNDNIKNIIVENTRMKNNRINMIHKSLILLLSNDIINDDIENDSLTFLNAHRNILLKSNNNIYYVVLNMIKYGNSFLYKNELLKNSICSINSIHRHPLSQSFFYEILVNNKPIIYCNNCIDVMSRYSKRKVQIIGNIQYKKLRRIFLLMRKSSIYHSLDIDCFNKIFNYCLYF
jgi:hypothetical protein